MCQLNCSKVTLNDFFWPEFLGCNADLLIFQVIDMIYSPNICYSQIIYRGCFVLPILIVLCFGNGQSKSKRLSAFFHRLILNNQTSLQKHKNECDQVLFFPLMSKYFDPGNPLPDKLIRLIYYLGVADVNFFYMLDCSVCF